ncbi:hypothetical protein Bbelb_237350 [Branchiostoma belcheri]|nr:hypothetical protein Bbelb_237350 [Branchiostoma belcheri]
MRQEGGGVRMMNRWERKHSSLATFALGEGGTGPHHKWCNCIPGVEIWDSNASNIFLRSQEADLTVELTATLLLPKPTSALQKSQTSGCDVSSQAGKTPRLAVGGIGHQECACSWSTGHRAGKGDLDRKHQATNSPGQEKQNGREITLILIPQEYGKK